MQKARVYALVSFVGLMLAFGAGLYAGVSSLHLLAATNTPQQASVDLSKFWEAWRILDEGFIQTGTSTPTPTQEERIYGAIKGLAESYGDPYTVFLPPQEAKQFNEDISGAFEGVGMELGARDGALTVVAPIKGAPAEKAGVRPGDVVMAIDGKPSRTMAVEEAVKLIRGKKGTTVTLMLARVGKTEPITVSIVRDTIIVPNIKTKNEGGIFTIELYSFSQNSPDLFRNTLREFFESGSTKLILDLRGNPGGYLQAAVSMASYFLPLGEPIVTEDFAGKQQNIVHRSFGYDVFGNKKLSMVILVDQGSASASEILAGALSQHGVAKLVGQKTFGKGSVQQLIDLGDGAELKVTIARWLTPNGSSIVGGITPDIVVEHTIDDVKAGRDPQRDAAVSWLVKQ